MKRREFLVALSGGLLAAPFAAQSQVPEKVSKVGVLWTTSASVVSSARTAFRKRLRDLGYVEGQNVVLEERFADDKPERLKVLMNELVRLRVDVIVTQGTLATVAAKEGTQTIPIVMTLAGNPVGSGIASSLSRPAGNITGLTNLGTELAPKRLDILRQALPTLSRLAVLWDENDPSGTGDAYGRRATEDAARSMGLTVQVVGFRGPEDLSRAFDVIVGGRPDALAVLPSSIVSWHVRPVVDLAARHRLPTMYQWRAFAEAGGLISYGPNHADQFARAAVFVDKILKGAKPSDLPIEQPIEVELVINLRTARTLGLTIPQSLLLRADEVIQ